MKVRIISALVVIAALIPILWIGGYLYALVITALSLLAYKELISLKRTPSKVPNLIKIFGAICIVYLILGNYGYISLEFQISYARLLIPMALILLPTIFYKKDKYLTSTAFYILGIVYLIGIFFNLLLNLRFANVWLLVYLISITILTDTFAYAIGKLIGRYKMAPKVSPNKTWEGFFGGLIGGTLIPLIIYTNLVGPFSIKILFVTIILSLVSELGDLFYSKIKRENDIKDFSNIMPGHGGVLDRLDSLTFVIFTYVILYWLV